MNNETLFEIIRTATEDVFSTMLNLSVETGSPYHEKPENKSFDGVVALIGLAGAWVGAGRVSCSASFACKISGALLMSEYDSVNEEVLDAMAEVTNMIIGNVKSQLEQDYGPMGLSIPTVIFGRNYKARSSGVSDWRVVPFLCEGERMDIKLCLVPGSETNSHRAEIAVQNAL